MDVLMINRIIVMPMAKGKEEGERCDEEIQRLWRKCSVVAVMLCLFAVVTSVVWWVFFVQILFLVPCCTF